MHEFGVSLSLSYFRHRNNQVEPSEGRPENPIWKAFARRLRMAVYIKNGLVGG
jgi:hypothetical protein